MNIEKLIETAAEEFSRKAHKGQYRKIKGEEYAEHPKRVAEIVKRFKKSHNLDALVNAAFLHDTIEDTNTTEEDLEKMFGGLVASLVKELTTDKKKAKAKGKEEYLSHKMENMSNWALVIKLADRYDNVSDLEFMPDNFKNKYKKETEGILRRLQKNRKLTSTQQSLVNAIKEKLEELNGNTNEEYVFSTRSYMAKDYIEVFRNPTLKELRRLSRIAPGGEVKFILNIDGKLYVWHSEIHEKITKEGELKPVLEGYAELKAGKLETIDIPKKHLQELKERPRFSKVIEKYFHVEKLNEEFYDSVTSDGIYYEIFKNPDQKEIKEVAKQAEHNSFRFFIDKRGNFYIFSSDLLHRSFAPKIPDVLIKGQGEITRSGRLIVDDMIREILKSNEKTRRVYKRYFASLDEEFSAGGKDRMGLYHEIFKNPSGKELRELERKGDKGEYNIRFLFNLKSGEIFMFSSDLLHYFAEQILLTSGKIKEADLQYFMRGVGKLSKNKIIKVDNYTKNSFKYTKIFSNAAKKTYERYFAVPSIGDVEIKESFETAAKIEYPAKKRSGYYEIFRNPNKKEIREIKKQQRIGEMFRVIVDEKRGNYFAFSNELLHDDAMKRILAKNQNLDSRYLSKGFAFFDKEKERIIFSHFNNAKKMTKLINKKYDI